MTKFYKHIVDHRNIILIIFLALTLICGLRKSLISVNYDMNAYLPPESASAQALDLMEQEYEGGIPNAGVMVQNVTLPKALAYKDKLLPGDRALCSAWTFMSF